jgi:hypothetical protein
MHGVPAPRPLTITIRWPTVSAAGTDNDQHLH